MKPVVLTPEQQKEFQGKYLIVDAVRVIALGEPIGLTVETFKGYWVNGDNILMEVTADDFYWFDIEKGDKDFAFTDDKEYISRNEIPPELVEFLDAVIEERMAV